MHTPLKLNFRRHFVVVCRLQTFNSSRHFRLRYVPWAFMLVTFSKIFCCYAAIAFTWQPFVDVASFCPLEGMRCERRCDSMPPGISHSVVYFKYILHLVSCMCLPVKHHLHSIPPLPYDRRLFSPPVHGGLSCVCCLTWWYRRALCACLRILTNSIFKILVLFSWWYMTHCWFHRVTERKVKHTIIFWPDDRLVFSIRMVAFILCWSLSCIFLPHYMKWLYSFSDLFFGSHHFILSMYAILQQPLLCSCLTSLSHACLNILFLLCLPMSTHTHAPCLPSIGGDGTPVSVCEHVPCWHG